ncbi:hypothetical protein PS862_04086 [Pseudomonas fluorescens]|uniref:Uncharacterized protein n=1 Tax=Pseudomonas fluorescens TaxID=294 RepID=A0A5E7MLH2_PSEFL|nr:hypothetical protein [Pseudomonas fluorescens]VVP25618.1 hypothetical protein PS862_04086 [Pseudomonas fluorescens]
MALIFDEYDAGRPDVMLEPQGKARARVLLTPAPFSAIKKGSNEAFHGADDWRLYDLDRPKPAGRIRQAFTQRTIQGFMPT